MAMAELVDLAAPQRDYMDLIEHGGYVEPMPGIALSFNRSDTEHLLRHHEQFSSQVKMDLGNVRPLIPLNVDPPVHSKYRKLLDPLFSPKRMDEQEADITRRVNVFIDTFVDRGECNFTDEFADLLPASVFLGLMGLPEEEMSMFIGMRDGILHADRVDPAAQSDMDVLQRVTSSTGEMIYAYFGELIDERATNPADDIITHFLAAEIDGERLTRDDILDICFLFLIAGLDTMTDMLTCTYAFLATHPEHRRMLADDASIIPTAVEELLRWVTPVAGSAARLATCPVDLPSGAHVTEGTSVVPVFGAANVDPGVFEDPLDVRFDRRDNAHMAFGGGVHRCLGSHLARRELRAVLREWHRRIPGYRLKPGHEELNYAPGVLRHVNDLTLTWP
jgi:cytochrome P450